MVAPRATMAAKVAERAARQSYGRLVAILAARTRDLPLAEEALADAFARALEQWSRTGVPDNPEGWLLTAARNGLSNLYRRDRTRLAATRDLIRQAEERAECAPSRFDERLALMFVCAHPAIDGAARAPLMLQTVLGVDAARIAAAFMVPPGTMGQRLVRAKRRIRETGLRFAVPEAADLAPRLGDVLDAIYVAFGASWDSATDGASGLPEEAIHLARVLQSMLPDEPEPKGLLALMLHVHARRRARHDTTNRFVPLSEQDASLWDRDMVIEAENLLTAAARSARFGRYQCEAAIQSVHAQRGMTGSLNHAALDTLYRLLVEHYPTLGSTTAYAAVRREMGDTRGALAILDALPGEAISRYQPALVVRAHCLADLRDPQALDAAQRALTATENPKMKAFLRRTLVHRAGT